MIDWLIQRAVDDPQVAVGRPPEDLLSTPEATVFDTLHSAKRRKDWLLGRWTAKRLVQAAAEKSGEHRPSCHEISVLAAKDGAPEVWLGEEGHLRRGNFNISISHSHEVSLCALITPETHLLGADIEKIEPRSGRFIEDYFSGDEKEAVRQASLESRDCLITATWSGKEAALKAVRQGLRLDTRSVNCSFTNPRTHPFGYRQESLKWRSFAVQWCSSLEDAGYPRLAGWWRTWQDFVITLVVADEPERAQIGREIAGRQ